MIQLNISDDDRQDIVDAERLLGILEEIVDALNDLDQRLTTIENSNP